MSALTDHLRRYGIFNSSGFASARGVLNETYPLDRPAPRCRIYGDHRIVPIVDYTAAQPGRGYKSACWQVTQGAVPTDPGGHWRDNGRKTFNVYEREAKKPRLEEALAWASERFGVTEWKRDPFGAYMPAEFVDARLHQLKDWMTENPDPTCVPRNRAVS